MLLPLTKNSGTHKCPFGGVVLGIEPRASCMLVRILPMSYTLQYFLILFWDSVILSCPGGLANMQFSSLSLPGSCNQRCMPPCTVKNTFKNKFSFQRFCKCNAIVLLKPKYFYFQLEEGMEITKQQTLLTDLLMLKLEQVLANSLFLNGVPIFVLNEDIEVISRENSLRKLEMHRI